MDILKLITNKDRAIFSSNYKYQTNFTFSGIIPDEKTANLKVALAKLTEGGALPVMAEFHALDAEAKIGDRSNYKRIELEKLVIKEKLNQTERVIELLGANAEDQEVIDFVFDDFGNLISRVLTRAELAKCQLVSTGKLQINENGFVKVIDYGFNTSKNTINFSDWANPAHSIVNDLNAVMDKATALGKTITKAVTSSKVVGYMLKNTELRAIFEKAGRLVTKQAMLQFIYETFNIQFAIDDEVYKKSANDTATHRFYPENKISFFCGDGIIGKGLYGPTAEELALPNEVKQNGLVTVTQWASEDPVAVWSKATALFIPVLADIDGLFIATITA